MLYINRMLLDAMLLFTSRRGFVETPLYLFKPRGPAGPIILFMGPIKLHIKGRVNNIKWIKG